MASKVLKQLLFAAIIVSVATQAASAHRSPALGTVKFPPINCATVLCALPVCSIGEKAEVPKGQCCPRCVPSTPDCSAVSCKPDCEENEELVVPEGQCCPQCVPRAPNCSAVICLRPVCGVGRKLVVPEGECCPQCQPIKCEIEGQEFSTCASLCPSTCNSPIRFCPAVCVFGCKCPSGQLIDPVNKICVPPEKCPSDPCALVDCKPNSICKVDPGTGEAFCEPSCDLNNGGCRDDQLCTLNQVQCVTTPCPPEVVCVDLEVVCSKEPDPGPCEAAIDRYFHNATSGQCERFVYGGCEGNENRFDTLEECQEACGVDPCNACPKGTICRTEPVFCINPPCGPDRVRCLDPDEICILEPETGPCRASFRRFFYNSTTDQCELFIYGGCGGNDNRFDTRLECISACDAVNPCIGFVCQQGSTCKVDDETGEAFCEPSCELDNGGCRENQTCQLQNVQCVRAPCPPIVNCIDRNPCATVLCRDGHQCEVFEPTGEPFCTPNCSLNNGGCAGDQICKLQTVQCIRAPCPPVVNCINRDPCATVRCANGYRCEVFEETGEAFCNPDCNLNNGGCPADQECRLKPVTCVRAPCPPIIQCVEQTDCPPTCSREFCSKRSNRRAMCSNPGPREIPGCTGSCQRTYCHTCYYSEEARPRPPRCDRKRCTNLLYYQSNSRCFRRWANCIRRAQWMLQRPDDDDDESFRCHNPPCPFIG